VEAGSVTTAYVVVKPRLRSFSAGSHAFGDPAISQGAATGAHILKFFLLRGGGVTLNEFRWELLREPRT
jgi:hypothetical protein